LELATQCTGLAVDGERFRPEDEGHCHRHLECDDESRGTREDAGDQQDRRHDFRANVTRLPGRLIRR
jgi:hypothetical protein